MINSLKTGLQMINELLAKYEQFRTNAENEFQVMSCGAFNPRLLARIKRSKVEKNKEKNKEKNSSK